MTKPIIVIKSELHKTGGLEKYTWQLVQDFCRQGVPVTLLTTGICPSSSYHHPLLNIISFPVHRSLSILHLLHFNKSCRDYLRQNPSPIIFSLDRTHPQTHMRAGNGVHAQYLKYRIREEGTLKACTFYLNPLHRVLCSVEKKAFEDPALQTVFVNSNMIKKEILDHFRIIPDKIKVMHNGVEWQQFQPDFTFWEEKKEAATKKYGLDSSVFQFLFLGHNYRRKGLDKLFFALEHMSNYPFQLSIVGKEKNISYYRHLAQRLGLAKKTFFFGASQEKMPFYQMADALVIPSLYDPFANVTVEALAMGLFVVSSKTNGGHEILSEHSGIVIEDIYNPSLFAHALKTAYTHRKTAASAWKIRSALQHLDFSSQLRKITSEVLNNSCYAAALSGCVHE